jgi:hypothetical protein
MPPLGLTSELNSAPSFVRMDIEKASIKSVTSVSEQNAASPGAGVDVNVLPAGIGVGDSVEMNVCVAVTSGAAETVAGGSGVNDGTVVAAGADGNAAHALKIIKIIGAEICFFMIIFFPPSIIPLFII